MSAFKINPGTYILNTTLDNPKPHGRKNGWQHRSQFTSGNKYIVADNGGAPAHLFAQDADPGDNIDSLDPRFFLILQHCTAVEETPSDYLIRTGQARRALELVNTLAGLLGYDLERLQSLLDSAADTEAE